MAWVLRGLRNGVVTTGYPRHSDPYATAFQGGVTVRPRGLDTGPEVERVCPTGALASRDAAVFLDRGRCILCGACVRAFPATFAWTVGSDTAAFDRRALVVPTDLDDGDHAISAVRAELARRVRRLRRSVHIRHVDAGSDGAEEWEILALTNPTYDVHRLGIFLTASPRHADILLVTGAGARGMLEPLSRTRLAMPSPVVVIAVGTDAISGGLIGTTYATTGGLLDQLAVDVMVPGSPPPPFAILHGILLALGRLDRLDRLGRLPTDAPGAESP
ncbi:MAG: NADH-quinone oxidoreductase subunit B family protein [Mycobacteriales bacterium]